MRCSPAGGGWGERQRVRPLCAPLRVSVAGEYSCVWVCVYTPALCHTSPIPPKELGPRPEPQRPNPSRRGGAPSLSARPPSPAPYAPALPAQPRARAPRS